jgi:hypothetical protein
MAGEMALLAPVATVGRAGMSSTSASFKSFLTTLTFSSESSHCTAALAGLGLGDFFAPGFSRRNNGSGLILVTQPANATGFLAAVTDFVGLGLSSDPAGWIASRKGAFAFTGATGVFETVGAGGDFGLPSNSGTVSILAGSGFVWAGTATGAMPGFGFASAFVGAAKGFFGEPNFGSRAAVRIR